jgi:hypothetical protein
VDVDVSAVVVCVNLWSILIPNHLVLADIAWLTEEIGLSCAQLRPSYLGSSTSSSCWAHLSLYPALLFPRWEEEMWALSSPQTQLTYLGALHLADMLHSTTHLESFARFTCSPSDFWTAAALNCRVRRLGWFRRCCSSPVSTPCASHSSGRVSPLSWVDPTPLLHPQFLSSWPAVTAMKQILIRWFKISLLFP